LDIRKIETYSYQLFPKGKLGSKAVNAPFRQGALLRITFSNGKAGYSDCFPWPELGDVPLATQLCFLKEGKLTTLTERSLEFAKIDAEARSEGKSLFKDAVFPQNHFLVTDYRLLDEGRLKALSEDGFSLLKVKVGSQPIQEAEKIKELFPLLKELSIQLRLDFNSSLTPEQVEEFLELLGPASLQIDFIEDPTGYHPEVWKSLQEKWNIRLAIDRIDPEQISQLDPTSFSVLVVKPAIQDWKKMASIAKQMGVSLVVTSYLDHPIGQLYATWVAVQLHADPHIQLEPCGLISQIAYEPNAFSVLLATKKNRLELPLDLGIGFSSVLEGLKWEEL